MSGAAGAPAPDTGHRDAPGVAGAEVSAGESPACPDAAREPGWGATLADGFGDGPGGPDAGDDESAVGPGWGATLADGFGEGPDGGGGGAGPSGVGPVFDALAAIDEHISAVLGLLDRQQVALADVPEVAVRLHTVQNRVQAGHLAAVGQVSAGGVLPPGPLTVTGWLRASHRLTPRAAGLLTHTAAWLAEHPLTFEALAAGAITVAHVTVMRKVSQANQARREAFAAVEATFVELAAQADPMLLRQVLDAWAVNVDPDTADEDADAAHAKRRLYLSPVADGWELDGWLPNLAGAELAGILNELMAQALRDAPADQLREAASARRADALMDAARAAAAGMSDAAAGRAAVVVTLPVTALHTCTGCGQPHHTPDPSCHHPEHHLCTCTGTGHSDTDSRTDTSTSDGNLGIRGGLGVDGASTGSTGDGLAAAAASAAAAAAAQVMVDALAAGRPDPHTATWAVGNGPGHGHLAPCQLRWATCDGEITRLILDPDSRPLDIGRATRTIPVHLRHALNVRDRGCVIPGCDRPTGWCHAHHVKHWADGGSTSVDNLVLLCARHHTELHLGHWHITITNRLPAVEHIPAGQRHLARTNYRRRQPQAA